jgi:outer membrane receptor protein involved in Fe transport
MTILRALVPVLLLAVWALPGRAQTGGAGIRGRVVAQETSRPVAGAAVVARPEGDTAAAGRATAGADGRFRIEGLAPGRYVVRATHAGMQAAESAPVAVAAGATADAGDVKLPRVVALDALEVRVQRPPVVHAEDRNVYSVKDMPAATGGAADIMRTLPELELDVDGNVKLAGNRPANIHINGRPSPLRGEALTEFVRNLPADRIDRIEVIPNPSVRFEGGDAAIVNIVLRRGTDLGLSGSLSANSSTRGSNGLSGQVAFQRGRLTLFGGGSGNLMTNDNATRELRQNLLATPVTILDTDRRFENTNFHGSTDLTAELTVGAKETVWASGSLYTGGFGGDGFTHTRLMDAQEVPIRIFDRVSNNESDFFWADFALGFRRIVEAQRHELSLEVRRSASGNDSEGRIEESTELAAPGYTGPLTELRLTGGGEDRGGLVLKADYMRPLPGKGGRVEVGVRTSVEDQDRSDSQRRYESLEGGDPTLSSLLEYDYAEDQHSAYANFSQKVGRVSLQGGLRGELNRLDLAPRAGIDQPGFGRDFFAVIPSANASVDFGQGRTLRLNYSRRTRRPWIWDLNPYVQQTDPLFIRLGNPDLELATTDSYGMDASWRASAVTLRLAPYYRRTSNEVEHIRTVDAAGVSTSQARNLSSVESVGTTLNASSRPAPWGTVSASMGASHESRDAGALGDAYSRSGSSYFGSANATVQPGRGWSLQGSLRANSPRRTAQGEWSSTPWTELSARKELFNRKVSMNLRAADPFGIFRNTFRSNDPSFSGSSRSQSSWQGRALTASVTWRFGGKPPQRKSSTGEGGAPSTGGGGPP